MYKLIFMHIFVQEVPFFHSAIDEMDEDNQLQIGKKTQGVRIWTC